MDKAMYDKGLGVRRAVLGDEYVDNALKNVDDFNAPLQDILNQLVRLHGGLVREEIRPYLRDVFDHAARISDATNAMGELLTAAMSVNLAMVSVGQNEVVKRLAGWAALLAAPTLIASWYGMNFHHMPELDKPYAYPLLILLTVSICVGLFVWLRREKWL